MAASDFKEKIHASIYLNLPGFQRDILKKLDMNIFEFVNGHPTVEQVASSKKRDFTLNLYYWSATEIMAEYFATEYLSNE